MFKNIHSCQARIKACILLSSSLLFFTACSYSELELKRGNAAEILEQAKTHSGREAVLLNFWATWCAPCIEEFPMIAELAENYKNRGLHVYFISVDWSEDEDKVLEFLERQGIKGISYIKSTQDDESFINSISTAWTGAVPFTILFDKQGNPVNQWEAEKSKADFIIALEKVLNPVKT